MQYVSRRVVESEAVPGVRFVVRRMSVGRRIELARRVNELSRKVEFLQAGGSEREHIEAAWLAAEIDGVYLRWGIESVEGLSIDGEPATPETLLDKGPPELCREALAAIRTEAALTGDERKN